MSKTIINPWNGQPMEIPEGGETTPAAVLAAAQGMTVPQKDATKAESRFSQLDKNSDGFLTKEEFEAGQKKKEKKS